MSSSSFRMSRWRPSRRYALERARPSRTVACAASRNLPRTPKEIEQYCRKALRAELQSDKFDIMRACLLVALEEEAALSVHQSIIFENLRAQGEMMEADVTEAVASINSRISSAVRSQFNTARIDALANDVLHAFVQALDLPLAESWPEGASAAGESQSAIPTILPRPTPPRPKSPDSTATESPQEAVRDLNASAAVEHASEASQTEHSTVPAQPAHSDEVHQPSTEASGQEASEVAPLRVATSTRHLAEHPAMPQLLASHTALFLHVASEVLFNVHGYRQPTNNKKSNMDSFLMNSVLETGVGAPIVLAIIFRAVCRRAQVNVCVSVLDGGSDCVLWPEGATGESGIRVSGHTLVLDIFSRGAVMLETEVKEFFDVDSLVPSSDRDLLFALLSGLQDCNWRLALQEDASWSRQSVAQCLQAALRPITSVKEPYHLSRAVASAERCLLVKPRHIELHLYSAALCFLDHNLHRCMQHLQLVYGGLDALGIAHVTGRDADSSGSDRDGGGDEAPRAGAPSGAEGKADGSVFALRRNVSVEDVCLLRRPRWQGALHAAGADASEYAVLGADARSGVASGVPEIRVVRRGSEGAAHGGGQEGTERVVARLREQDVVLRRPRRSALGAIGAGSGGSGSGWEWGEGEAGELVVVGDGGEKVTLDLTAQAPLPLDRSIMGEVTENMGLLWHKAALMQQMGDIRRL